MPPFDESPVLKDLKKRYEKCLRDIVTTQKNKEEYTQKCDKIISNCEEEATELERVIAWLSKMPKGVKEDAS